MRERFMRSHHRGSHTRRASRWTLLLIASLGLNGWLVFEHYTASRASSVSASVRVLSFDQSGEPRTPALLLRFSAEMAEADDVGMTVSKTMVWSEPSVPIDARWASPFAMVVRPSGRLPSNRSFHLHLSPALGSVQGHPLVGVPHEGYPFSSGRLRPVGDVATHYTVEDRPAFTLLLNGPVAMDALKRHLSIWSGDDTDASYTIRARTRREPHDASTPYRYDVVLNDKRLRAATFKLQSGLLPTRGDRGLAESVEHALTWTDRLKINSLRASRSASSARLVLSLSQAVDRVSLKTHLRTEPPCPTMRIHVDEHEVTLRGDFKSHQVVGVVLTAGLKTALGITLREDIRRTVVVPAPSPRVSFARRGIDRQHAGAAYLVDPGCEYAARERAGHQNLPQQYRSPCAGMGPT